MKTNSESKSQDPRLSLLTKLSSLNFEQFNIEIGLPLHPHTYQPIGLIQYQKDFIKEIPQNRQFECLINKSRQIGCSELMLRVLAYHAFHKYAQKKIMIIAGTKQDEANDLMARLQMLFTKFPEIVTNQNKSSLELANSTKFLAFPSNSRAWRGREKVGAVFLDEAAHFNLLDDSTIYDALNAFTLSGKADLYMISTPNGKRGIFHRLWHEQNEFKKKQWDYHFALGYLYEQQQIDIMRANKAYNFAQEHECQFTSTKNAAIPPEVIAKAFEKYNMVEIAKLCGIKYAGFDVALIWDYSAIVIIGRLPDHQYKVIHLKQWERPIDWAVLEPDIQRLYDEWKWNMMAADQTGLGEVVVSDIIGRRIPVEGIKFTIPTKEDMRNNLIEMIDTNKLRISDDLTELRWQMEEQERIITDAGHVQFRHPEGRHDDQFWGLAMACYMTKTAQEHGIIAL